jgi:hypothetical protein
MFIDLDHLWRCPTVAAMNALAKRLGLPPPPLDYDWELAVADPTRINEFVALYESGGLTDDERFTLMEVILNSVIDAAHIDTSILTSKVWQRILTLLEQNIESHIYSVWYYSDVEQDDVEDSWWIAPFMRPILVRHQGRFAKQ